MAKSPEASSVPNGTPETVEQENDIEDELVPVNLDDFKVIGSLKRPEAVKIRRNLPQWMIQAQKFEANIEKNSCPLEEFQESSSFPLDDRIIQNLKSNNITNVFPVQRVVIPQLLQSFHHSKYGRQPNDLWILSSTGSGKTLSYALPIMNRLLGATNSILRALVILPVADLALQVYNVFTKYSKGTHLRIGLATSGSTKDFISKKFMKNAYTDEQFCMIDILIATPGKLLDLLENEPVFNLKNLEMLVVDEADRMMSETQVNWLEKIQNSVYGEQSLLSSCYGDSGDRINLNHETNFSTRKSSPLFKILISATLSSDPEKLDSMSLYNPKLICSMNENIIGNDNKIIIDTDPRQTIPANLKEFMVICDKSNKPMLVWYLLAVKKITKVLCFTNTIEATRRLYSLLKSNQEFRVAEIHGDQKAHERKIILKDFENGNLDVIISTDIFARGLDVSGIDYVLCYDVPRNDTAYVHKVGRTARAGKDGTAITLVARDELRHFGILSRKAHHGQRENAVEKMIIANSETKKISKQFMKALKSLESSVGDEAKRKDSKIRKQIRNSRFTKRQRKLSDASSFDVETMNQ